MKRTLGTCYYPEHWPEEIWEADARRMAETGLTWIRIGEFAWSRLEPRPGDLRFEWLDRAIETLGQAGLKVVLRCRRQTAQVRLPPPLLLFARGFSSGERPDRTARRRALRQQSVCRRLADRQRIRLPRHHPFLFGGCPKGVPGLAEAALRLYRGAQPRLGKRLLVDGVSLL